MEIGDLLQTNYST